MEILFADASLERSILLDRPHPKLPARLVPHARLRLRLLQSIPDMRTLQNMKSARFQPNTARKGVHRIGISEGHHFLAKLDEKLTPPAITIIGCTTFVISIAGVYVGNVFGSRYKSRAELTGGVILILIGLKILLEHLGVIAF